MQQEPFLVHIARQWGWRAYAIPVLVVLTAVILFDIFAPSQGSTQGQATMESSASEERSGEPGPIPAEKYNSSFEVGDLPPGPPFAEKSSGEFKEVSLPQPKVGKGSEKPVAYAVEVESTVDAALSGGGDAFAATVNAIFADPRGWTADERYSFEAVKKDRKPTMLIQLVATETAHQICGNTLGMETSCFISGQSEGEPGRVIVNNARWSRGTIAFQGDLGLYRQYLVNHEVGHGLGYASHEPCAVDGAMAPIMMQQTLSLSNDELHRIDPNEVYAPDGKKCAPNGWPYPMGPRDKQAAPTQEAR